MVYQKMSKNSRKSKDPTWTPAWWMSSQRDIDSTFDDSFCSDEYFSDIAVSEYESDPSESLLRHQLSEHESILDHQNSIFTTNAFEDAFGVFGKYLSQFKTVLEKPATCIKPQENVEIEYFDEENFPELLQPFHFYVTAIVKEESPIKSCLEVIEITDDEPEMPVEAPKTPDTPTENPPFPFPVMETPFLQSGQAPLATSTPFLASTPFKTPRPKTASTPKSCTPKSSGKKNSSILDYFKPRDGNNNNRSLNSSAEEEVVGELGTLKRKRTNEMEDEKEQENINPAKKMLVVK